jgi:hypothetical protein
MRASLSKSMNHLRKIIKGVQSTGQALDSIRVGVPFTPHGQVGWMPRLPAAGAGRAVTDSRSGVKADPLIISTFPGSPALWAGSFTPYALRSCRSG